MRLQQRAPGLRHHPRGKVPLLAPNVTYVDYKDVDLLRRFLSEKGKIRPRRPTGVTPRQQRAVARAIKTAREVALLPYAGQR